MLNYTSIRNHHLVVARLGFWPDFRDTEVISLHLERTIDTDTSPILLLQIYTSSTTLINNVRSDNHTLITFRFVLVTTLQLQNFNDGNILSDLRITPSTTAPTTYEVVIATSYGLSGAFTCAALEVSNAQECDPNGKL